MGFNKEQQSAIDASIYEDVLVAAGAGSGKTSTILGKAKYLVERRNIDPAKVQPIHISLLICFERLDGIYRILF